MPDSLVRYSADVEDVKPEAERAAGAFGETCGGATPYGALHPPTRHPRTADGRKSVA